MEASTWQGLLDALTKIEAAPPEASGLLSFGPPVKSEGIFVERGEICWAAANGMQNRLADLLQKHPALVGVDVMAFYRRCHEEGKLFGQSLIAEGWISRETFDRILRTHSAECLIALAQRGAELVWTPHQRRGYAPGSTFRAVDALFDAVAVVAPQLQERARVELASIAPPGCRGAAFLVGADLDDPVPLVSVGEARSVAELLALGRWSSFMPLAIRDLDAVPSFTLAVTSEGETVSVWWRGPMLFVLACEDRASAAAVTSHHLSFS